MGKRTRQLVVQVLVVFVAEAVGGDVGAGFGITDVLQLVGILFDADLAKVAQGTQDCRHGFSQLKEGYLLKGVVEVGLLLGEDTLLM